MIKLIKSINKFQLLAIIGSVILGIGIICLCIKINSNDNGIIDEETLSSSSVDNLLNDNTKLLYVDLFTSRIFYYDGELYQEILRSDIATASENNPGIMKLYATTGQNIDGTMTQKAITDELNEKVEITLNIEEELIIFSNN